MDLNIEQKYKKQGYDFVIGIDEAGRGPLAGPVVASAVAIYRNILVCHPPVPVRTGSRGGGSPEIACPNAFRRASSLAITNNLDPRLHGDDICNYGDVKDSKKISPKNREKIFELLTESPDIKYGIGIVSEKIIDKENILRATLMAMKKAVEDLMKKNPKITPQNSVILIDGKDIIESLDFDQHSIIGGDDKVWSVAAASIIAKVSRDKIMGEYHKKYPQYCFDKHKGYGTKLHFGMIAKHGQCEIHRKSFLQ